MRICVRVINSISTCPNDETIGIFTRIIRSNLAREVPQRYQSVMPMNTKVPHMMQNDAPERVKSTNSDVRVVIPTYNRGKRLIEAISSVQRQTYSDWRITVVDDGSTDETRKLLENVNEPRLDLISSSHSGRPGLVRNIGIRNSKEAFIAFLDSDDLWNPNKLQFKSER